MNNQTGPSSTFQDLAEKTARAVGTSWAFLIALSVVVIWAVSGPFCNFSDTWWRWPSDSSEHGPRPPMDKGDLSEMMPSDGGEQPATSHKGHY